MDKCVVPEKTAVIEKKTCANRMGPEVSGSILAYATFLTELFAEFHARDIGYCVLRNFEGLPDRVDGDIDILVRSADLQKAETTLVDLMEGFLLIRRVERNGHLQFYVTSEYEMEAAVRENRAAQTTLWHPFIANRQLPFRQHTGLEHPLHVTQELRVVDFLAQHPE